MINIAAFIDNKDNKLSVRSTQLLRLIQDMQSNNPEISSVHLFTTDEVNSLDLPLAPGATLTMIHGLSDAGIFSSAQMHTILATLSNLQINCVVGYKNSLTDQIFPAYSAQTNLPLLGQVLNLKLASNTIELWQSIFSGKASTFVKVSYKSVLSFNNAFEIGIPQADQITLTANHLMLEAHDNYQINNLHKASAGVNLADATYVVGAGRGLKDPSNWTLIEDLAAKIGAATACSKPVSDIDWRPHSEHVGQTGIKIAPKLYIACGISGAIQHLAGVNGSKTIIVINNDPEAPFFKYADYGIVGDVFDVLPELIKNL